MGNNAPLPVGRTVGVVAEGLGFPEGPVCFGDGTTVVADIRGGVLKRISKDGVVDVLARTGGGPNGLAVGSGGALYCVNNGGLTWQDGRGIALAGNAAGSLQRIESDGTATTVCSQSDSGRLCWPNDVAVDPSGGIWFTDSGSGTDTEDGKVLYLAPGAQSATTVAEGYQFANGLAFDADTSALVVAETMSRKLWRHQVLGTGFLGPRRLLTELDYPDHPDGLCVDTAGNVLVAAMAGGAVVAVDTEGKVRERVELGHKQVTNVAFGGPGNSTVFVTVSGLGQLAAFSWPIPGLRLPFGNSERIP